MVSSIEVDSSTYYKYMSAQAKPANTIDMSNIKPKTILTKIKGGNKYRSKHNIIRHKSLQASTYQKDSEVPEENSGYTVAETINHPTISIKFDFVM